MLELADTGVFERPGVVEGELAETGVLERPGVVDGEDGREEDCGGEITGPIHGLLDAR